MKETLDFTKIDLSQSFTLLDDVVFKSNPDQTILMTKLNNDDAFFVFEELDFEIVSLIAKEKLSIQGIVEKLLESYEIDSAELEKYIISFLNQLKKLDLISPLLH